MKSNKAKRTIRTDNRFGKTEMGMAAEANRCCDDSVQDFAPRRSIPVKEVDEIVQRAVARVKASKTIYDDRNDLLERLSDNESCIAYHETQLHEVRLRNKSIRSDLAQANLAIIRELELSGV